MSNENGGFTNVKQVYKYFFITALVATAASANMLNLGSVSVSGANGYISQSFTVVANQPLSLFLNSYLSLSGQPFLDGPSCTIGEALNCYGRAALTVSGFGYRSEYYYGENSGGAVSGLGIIPIPQGFTTIAVTMYQYFTVPDPAFLPINTTKIFLSTDSLFEPTARISFASSPAHNPEPGTWAMLFSGLGALSLGYYRHRHRPSAHRA